MVNLKSGRLAQFSDLVHMIYAASAEPSRWTDVIAAVAKGTAGGRLEN